MTTATKMELTVWNYSVGPVGFEPTTYGLKVRGRCTPDPGVNASTTATDPAPTVDWCVDFNAAARALTEVSGVILARAQALLERAKGAL